MPTKRFSKKYWKMVIVLITLVLPCCYYAGRRCFGVNRIFPVLSRRRIRFCLQNPTNINLRFKYLYTNGRNKKTGTSESGFLAVITTSK